MKHIILFATLLAASTLASCELVSDSESDTDFDENCESVEDVELEDGGFLSVCEAEESDDFETAGFVKVYHVQSLSYITQADCRRVCSGAYYSSRGAVTVHEDFYSSSCYCYFN